MSREMMSVQVSPDGVADLSDAFSSPVVCLDELLERKVENAPLGHRAEGEAAPMGLGPLGLSCRADEVSRSGTGSEAREVQKFLHAHALAGGGQARGALRGTLR